jgi:hypothetical protein
MVIIWDGAPIHQGRISKTPADALQRPLPPTSLLDSLPLHPVDKTGLHRLECSP